MSVSKKIQLFKIRDFGLVFNDTFDFIKQNWKPIFKAIAIIAGPFYFLAGALLGSGMDSVYNFDLSNPNIIEEPDFSSQNLILYGLGYFVMMLFFLIGYILAAGIVFTYFKMYRNDEITEDITTSEIWAQVKPNLGMIAGTFLLVSIITFIGFMFCLLPGIYLAIPLSMIFITRLEEPKLSFSDAFKRCFELSKNCWWVTFALLAIMSILVSAINYGLSLPLTILSYAEMFLEFNDFGIVQSLSYGINMLISLLLSSITLSTMAVIYYSHRERLEGIGLQDRISSIGETDNSLPDSSGEY